MPIGVDTLGAQTAPAQVSRAATSETTATAPRTEAVEAPETERDLIGAQEGIEPPSGTEVERAETRNVGQALQVASEEIGVAQQAVVELEAGEASLARLGTLAAEGQAPEDTEDEAEAETRNAEAAQIARRLRQTDNSDVVERVRRAITAQRERFDALRADREDPEAPRLPSRPPLPDQPTLALVPRGLTGEEDATLGGRPVGGDASARPEISAIDVPTGEPFVAPTSTDVSTPEAAEDTQTAVSEALSRVSDLRRQVQIFGQDAETRARDLVGESAQRRGPGRTLGSAPQAEATAQRIARSTVENPAAAVNSQPFVSVEAALRVLA